MKRYSVELTKVIVVEVDAPDMDAAHNFAERNSESMEYDQSWVQAYPESKIINVEDIKEGD